MHESIENSSLQFKSDVASKVFDSLVDSFIEDYMVKKYVAERSGWRTLAEIAVKSRISPSTLYGKHSTLGSSVDEPIRRGIIETRIFPGERGRGGEILRLRIAYDKEPIREFVNNKILHGKNVVSRKEDLERKVQSLDPFELKISKILSDTSIFSSLTEDKILEIVKESEKVSFSPNEFIVREGDLASGFFLMLDGQVEARKRGNTLRRMGRGQFFGETTLAENESRSADIIVVEQATCLKLTASYLKQLIKIEPQVAVKLLEEMVKRNRGITKAKIDE